MMNFAAIDFETANNKRNSACSVAVVEVKDGQICDSYYALIRPPEMDFSYFNIQIHGIHPEDVKDKPTFAGIWPELRKRLENRIVVAHNAQFDMSVLKYALNEYKLPEPKFNHCCTVSLARKLWPELENHKLDTVGHYLNIDFKHHDALEDAKTCAAIPIVAGQQLKVENFAELVRELGVAVKPFKC
jgi:DNA polymerase III subunit epsilon